MSGIPVTRRVETPAELVTLLREIKAAIATGLLEQIRPDPSPFATDAAISDVPDNGPWPDYVELRFRARGTGERHKLTAEIYHGVGGTWGPE